MNNNKQGETMQTEVNIITFNGQLIFDSPTHDNLTVTQAMDMVGFKGYKFADGRVKFNPWIRMDNTVEHATHVLMEVME